MKIERLLYDDPCAADGPYPGLISVEVEPGPGGHCQLSAAQFDALWDATDDDPAWDRCRAIIARSGLTRGDFYSPRAARAIWSANPPA